MMEERRRDDRVKVDLEVSWEGALSQLRGSIVDLSTSGCFILTDDQVRVGELIRVTIRLPRQGEVSIWGEVVYQIAEMGFAVRFTGADEADMKLLALIVKAELLRRAKE
jgi:c-di-GMP-binding flagellar brake protein YcgR